MRLQQCWNSISWELVLIVYYLSKVTWRTWDFPPVTESQVIDSWPRIPSLTVEPRIPFRRRDGYYSEFLLPKGRDAYSAGSHDASWADIHGAEECAAVSQDCALSSFISLDYPLSQFMIALYSFLMRCPWPMLCFGSHSLFLLECPSAWPFYPQRLPEFCRRALKTFPPSPNWNLCFPFVSPDPYSPCIVSSVPFFIS